MKFAYTGVGSPVAAGTVPQEFLYLGITTSATGETNTIHSAKCEPIKAAQN